MNNDSKSPLVSIGIPTYNRNKSLIRTLASIWMQEYSNLEVVISDNCSTDTTPELIEEISQNHPEIRYHRQSINIGMISNFEYVLRKATGKYFMWVADDDLLEADVLNKYVKFLEEHSKYSLVSGLIQYSLGDKQSINESGFTFEQSSSVQRVVGYYSKVVYGGMMHGLMRRDLTKEIILRPVIGNDFHFIANLAYLGEIKHLSFIGYYKSFGGTSRSFKEYARHLGDSNFAGKFPHLKMAFDAFAEVMYYSPVYSQMPLTSKLTLAASSFTGMMFRYYGRIFPTIVAGRIKRFVSHPL